MSSPLRRRGSPLAAVAFLFLAPQTAAFAESAPAPAVAAAAPAQPRARGWLAWRGPGQNGVSTEGHLPSQLAKPLWTVDLPGRGAPVIANGRLYTEGWRGEDPELQEVLVALDAETGRELWSHGESDFLSDTVYNRYAIGAPTVDPATGNLYALTAFGVFTAYTADGKILWQHSMMEEFGRLTFPNSRTGSPILDDDLVIVRGITSNWGAQGAPRDRFYAFDKVTGAHVWASTPGDAPKDNSFATPVLGWFEGQRVFWTGTGCGNLVCVNARTGMPMWRYPVSSGGVNASVVADAERVYVVHGVENLDASTVGRMVAVDLSRTKGKKANPAGEPAVLDKSIEAWRNDASSFSSSPVLANGRIYLTNDTGELLAIDAKSGKTIWRLKLARDQVHASPLLADGKLYVPMNDGSFHIVQPGEKAGKVLATMQLEGNCLGAPAAWNGKVFVQTTAKLYAFGAQGGNKEGGNKEVGLEWPALAQHAVGEAAAIQARPSEILLKPGDKVVVSTRKVDANGFDVGDAGKVSWAKFVPATAKVKSYLDAEFDAAGTLVAGIKPSAGAFEGTAGTLKGTIRGRLVPGSPIKEDFEGFTLAEDHPIEKGVKFAFPPLPWIGGRFAWEVRDQGGNPGGNKVLAKTLDTLIRQRAQTFIGLPEMKGYTIAADAMSDGNRRLMSDVGVIAQRYRITLKGTWQQLEVTSNDERLKVSVPFKWQPGKWYRLAARVDEVGDGKVVVRAKAWLKGEAEPANWTLEVPHAHGHTHGSPGFYGFAPDGRFRVYLDNVQVTDNAK